MAWQPECSRSARWFLADGIVRTLIALTLTNLALLVILLTQVHSLILLVSWRDRQEFLLSKRSVEFG
jgi:4-amino-4-deoxy-L-arabinose transferase-like glycosyltransferase